MTAFPRWYRPPTLGDPNVPRIVVEASAGTGKTWFVTRRVIDLLLSTDATIDRIVVVTYTEKATAELRLRLRELLNRMVHGAPEPMPAGAGESDAWILDDERRARLVNAIEGFDAAPISTIHGFCQRVLADESFATRRSFEQVQVPDDAALRAAFVAALRERFARREPERGWLTRYLEGGGSVEKLFEVVLAVYRSGAELDRSASGPGPQLVVAMVDEVIARADRDKRRGGLLDFQDMLKLTADAVTGPGGEALARRLATQFPWALIDEFQDTDPLQWRIIDRVWGQPPARGLTVVGDPKQAIYSFRGGDVHTYVEATRALRAREALEIDLDTCQRATEAMVATVNHLITTPATIFSGGIEYRRPVKATGAVELHWSSGAPVKPLALLPLEAANAPELRAQLTGAVADEIARLLLGPGPRLEGTLRGERRPLRPADIMVLTRRNDDSLAVASAIRARGVPCALAQAEYLFSTIEARDVLDLLEAIARPRDRSARLRAWMTDFFDVDAEHLARAQDLGDDHPLCARLHDWRQLAVRLEYPKLFASIMADSQVAERALATGRGERAVTNLFHVLEHLNAEVERSRCELPALVSRLRTWIRDAEAGRPDDSDVQRQETDGDAVQVMTMHRAKGLEAWVVFVASVSVGENHNRPTRLYHEGSQRRIQVAVKAAQDDGDGDGAAAVKRLAEEDQRAEDQRLAYVALTRARGRLYLPVIAPKNSGKSSARSRAPKAKVSGGGYSGVTAALFDNLHALQATAGDHPLVRWDPWAPAAAQPEPLDVSTLELPPPPAVPERAPAPLRAGFLVTSYSRLKAQAKAELEVAREEVTGEDRSPHPPAADDLPGGAATGHLLHEVLEHVDLASAFDAPSAAAWLMRPGIDALFARAERRHGVAARHRGRAAELVWNALRSEIVAGDLRLPPLGRARLAREVEFVFPIPDLPLGGLGPRASGLGQQENGTMRGRGFIKGFIDALARWDGDERWFVVDYKSDLVDVGAEKANEHVTKHYDVQVRLYALAAAAMMKLADPADHARRFGGLLYYFLRSGKVIHRAPTAADLDHYRAELARMELA